MAKFQNKILAAKEVVFPYVGKIKLDAEGFFEVQDEKLIAELKNVPGFSFISEAKKPEPKPKPAVPVAPVVPPVAPAVTAAPEKEETKSADPVKD